MLEMLLMIAIFAFAVYFLMVRPQKKQMAQQKTMLDALQPGDRILVANWLFATIREVSETQAFVELAPGVEVTIKKLAISRVVQPEEEEFEITDEAEEAELESEVLAEPQDPAGEAKDQVLTDEQPSEATEATAEKKN